LKLPSFAKASAVEFFASCRSSVHHGFRFTQTTWLSCTVRWDLRLLPTAHALFVREKSVTAGDFVSALKMAADKTRAHGLQMQNQL
jgi:hypothetical protein